MHVIDVDSHFEPTALAPDEHPLWELRDHLPDFASIMIANLAGDLYRELPPDQRPEPGALLGRIGATMGMSADQIDELAAARQPAPGAADAPGRIAWMDRVGIDYGFVNPGGAYAGSVASSHQFIDDPALRHRAMVLCNDYLVDHFAAYTDRVSPVTILDFDDLDWSTAELRRMRERGSRAYFVWATPFEGRSPAHPDVDRFWRASTDLGMVAVLHIGNTPAHFAAGWADAGWDEPRGGGTGGLLRFANSQRTQAAQTFLAALLFGGAFTRNAGLTVVLAELWASWLPWFVSRLDMLGDANGALGEWGHELSPGALARRHVKASPLPGLHDDGMGAIHEVPDMLVFSSDFPHNEGNAEPIALYADALDEVDPATRAAFMGGNMTDVFDRMGDPLPLSRSKGTFA
jgi:predicted TIM-barrel fold metal-dependent hydrolase